MEHINERLTQIVEEQQELDAECVKMNSEMASMMERPTRIRAMASKSNGDSAQQRYDEAHKLLSELDLSHQTTTNIIKKKALIKEESERLC